MLALINTDVYESVLDDLSSKLQTRLSSIRDAAELMHILEEQALDGATGELLYSEMDRLIANVEANAPVPESEPYISAFEIEA